MRGTLEEVPVSDTRAEGPLEGSRKLKRELYESLYPLYNLKTDSDRYERTRGRYR